MVALNDSLGCLCLRVKASPRYSGATEGQFAFLNHMPFPPSYLVAQLWPTSFPFAPPLWIKIEETRGVEKYGEWCGLVSFTARASRTATPQPFAVSGHSRTAFCGRARSCPANVLPSFSHYVPHKEMHLTCPLYPLAVPETLQQPLHLATLTSSGI